jgi:ubiquinone/menaquinone biosynthesis C-methylase UbiE
MIDNFSDQYIQLRHWEGRIYTDQEVLKLPQIEQQHPHSREWKYRRDSSKKLYDYLEKKERPLHIMEIGCGNGWLTSYLSSLEESRIVGIDINKAELSQAIRLFGNRDNVRFIQSRVENIDEENSYDIIVFAASLQYFQSLNEIVEECNKILKENGEIHILDTPFYFDSDIAAARRRSELYFEATGFPELSKFYFHHCLDELEPFQFQVLYHPNSLFSRFLRNKNPFSWIRIQK